MKLIMQIPEKFSLNKSGQVTPNYEGRKHFRDSTRSHLDNLVSQAAGQSSAVGLNVDFGHSAVLNKHGEPLATHVAKNGG